VLSFPSFVLYDSRAWDEALRQGARQGASLPGDYIYNGRIGPNGYPVSVTSPTPYTGASIGAWVAGLVGQRPAVTMTVTPSAPNPYSANCSRVSYVGPPRGHW